MCNYANILYILLVTFSIAWVKGKDLKCCSLKVSNYRTSTVQLIPVQISQPLITNCVRNRTAGLRGSVSWSHYLQGELASLVVYDKPVFLCPHTNQFCLFGSELSYPAVNCSFSYLCLAQILLWPGLVISCCNWSPFYLLTLIPCISHGSLADWSVTGT